MTTIPYAVVTAIGAATLILWATCGLTKAMAAMLVACAKVLDAVAFLHETWKRMPWRLP